MPAESEAEADDGVLITPEDAGDEADDGVLITPAEARDEADEDVLIPAAVVPAERISRETLIYVGFTESQASLMWKMWRNWPKPRETDRDDCGTQPRLSFLDFIFELISYSTDVDGNESDDAKWRECLDSMGIDDHTQTAIMEPDPAFKNIRLSESCEFWVKDYIQTRYDELVQILNSKATSEARETAGKSKGSLRLWAKDGWIRKLSPL